MLGTTRFPPVHERPSCSDQNGQYNDGGVHQSPRRCVLAYPAKPGEAPAFVGGSDTQAVHVPGRLNCGTDMLSREGVIHGKWKLHPHTVEMIWIHFGEAEINLFVSEENTHWPLFFSLMTAPLGGGPAIEPLAQGSEICIPSNQNYAASAAKGQGGKGCCTADSTEMAQPAVVPGGGELISPPVADPAEEGPSVPGEGHQLATKLELWDLHVWQVNTE